MTVIRETLLPPAPPPRRTGGPVGWLRANLFSGPGNTLTTLAPVSTARLPPIKPPEAACKEGSTRTGPTVTV